MYTNFKLIFPFAALFLSSCIYTYEDKKNAMVVYPAYCQGCVVRNFSELDNKKIIDQFNVYFDTTDYFVLQTANKYHLNYEHIDNNIISNKFGDFANVLVIDIDGNKKELSTNETITKGVHY